MNKDLNTPTIYSDKLKDYIVVYLESVAGNPLNSPNVVRWFLNKPGFYTDSINYGKHEIYFYHQENFNDKNFINDKNKLYVGHYPLDKYIKTNVNKRNGLCYILRKGKGRKLIHDDSNAICLDGLTHYEIAKIFNEKEYFYCYDLYSSYAHFAALCGCIPVVIPQNGLSSKEWQPTEYLRYGIAYGFEEIDYAIKTQDKASLTFKITEEETNKDLKQFIYKTQEYFSKNSKSAQDIENEQLTFIQKLRTTKNKIVYFGASESLAYQIGMLEFNGIYADYLCDNDLKKTNKTFLGLTIYSPSLLFKSNYEFDVVITSIYVEEIKEQLLSYPMIKNIYSIY